MTGREALDKRDPEMRRVAVARMSAPLEAGARRGSKTDP
jgi:hypothetical protein